MSDQPGVGARRRRRRDPAATREEIIAAARTVLAADGPDGLSLSKVAHTAGINRGTAYQHFETREELIKATVEWVSQHLSETVLGLKNGETPDSLKTNQRGVNDAIAKLADFAVENPELGRIWLFEMLSSSNPDEDVFFRHFRQSTAAMAASELSEPGIDSEVLSVIILAGCFLWPVLLRTKARSERERRTLAERMRREILRLSLHGTLRADSFPQLQALLAQ